MKLKYWILIATVALSACDGGTEWSDPPYEVAWIDIASNRSLYLSLGNGGMLGRVEPEVIAVGSNNKYVVVKQRRHDGESVSYYYIAKSEDSIKYNGYEITKGPFNAGEFEALSNELKLPGFSHEFR